MVNESHAKRKTVRSSLFVDEERRLETKEPENPIKRDVPSHEAFQRSVDGGSPDYAIVVLAVGKWAARQKPPISPPAWAEWALAECVALYEQSQLALGPIIGRYARKRDRRTEERLAKVADIMVDIDAMRAAVFRKKPSARAAIHHVLNVPVSETENQAAYRLQVLWRRDRQHQIVQASLRLTTKLRERGWLKKYPPPM